MAARKPSAKKTAPRKTAPKRTAPQNGSKRDDLGASTDGYFTQQPAEKRVLLEKL